MDSHIYIPEDEIVATGELQALSETVDWGLVDIAIPKLWEKSKGENITVAVLDTGITNHDDLNENILWDKYKSYISNEELDGHGHGTMVAGVISAKDSGFGVVGVAPNTKILPIKVLPNSVMFQNSTDQDLTNALKYCLEMGVDIINMSLGSLYKQSQAFQEVLIEVYNNNIPIVCAMGNYGEKYACFPANFPQTFGVTSYGKGRNISTFSSRGYAADFALPGEDILTTTLNNKYSIVKGTSFSSPFLAGIISLILSKAKKENKKYTIEELKQLLISCSSDYGPPGKDNMYGYGIINTDSLINKLLNKI
jgi:subtilisin family serine protease